MADGGVGRLGPHQRLGGEVGDGAQRGLGAGIERGGRRHPTRITPRTSLSDAQRDAANTRRPWSSATVATSSPASARSTAAVAAG